MMEPVVMLDADLTAVRARAVLENLPAGSMVVVRRAWPDGRVGLLWYAVPVDELRDLLARAPDEQPVSDVLDLHEHQAQDAREVTGADVQSGRWTGIVVDGGRAIGYARATRRVTRGLTPSPSPAPPPAPGPPPPPVPTVEAYPRLDVPSEVLPGARFDVVVGLSAAPPAGIPAEQAPGMRIPAPTPTIELVVQVVADGFTAPEGIRRTLVVARDDPAAATVTVPLVAPTDLPNAASARTSAWRGVVEIDLSVAGAPVGRAWREVVVSPSAAPGAPTSVAGAGLAVAPTGAPAADLTVSISEGADPARLLWTFTTPHDVPLPTGQVLSELPVASAMSFALGQIKDVATADGTSVAENRIKGIARAVASATPVEFWEVLCAVWALVKAQGQVPSVLLVSSDPYVPWELASVEPDWVVDQTLVDQAAPAVLGAQVRMGRWLPAGPRTPSGVQRPTVPPTTAIEVTRMAVVVGDYQSESGLRPLPNAIEEGRTLTDTYPSVWVKGTLDEVDQLLDGTLTERGKKVDVQVVHVACHGEVDPAHPAYNGMVLSDTALRMDATIVRGSELGRTSAPLVFLNACQLAQSTGDLLCDYGGLAGAFLTEGCRGFLAPLWSVEDGLAYDTAVEFYRLCLDEHVGVGEAVRRLRGRFTTIPGRTQTTPLAYVFYGHPDLELTLAK